MNSRRKAGRTALSFSKYGVHQKFSDYQLYLSTQVPNNFYEKACLFTGACELGLDFKNSDVITDSGYGVMTLPSVILAAKELLPNTFPLLPQGSTHFNSCIVEAKEFTEHAEGIDFDFNFPNPATPGEDVLRYLIWALSSNHQYQGDMPHEMANTLILSGISGYKSLTQDSALIDAEFMHHNAMVAKDYYILLFGLWALATKNYILNRNNILQHSPNKNLIQPALNTLLSSLSFKFDTPFNDPMFSHASLYTGKAKSEAIISLRPLIQVENDIYFSCGQPYIKIQITRKFLPKALFYARSRLGNASTPLSSHVGTRLELFFKELCNDWNPLGGHFDEYFYDRPLSKLSSDRVAFEKYCGEEIAILFQLKAKTMIEKAVFGGQFIDLKKDIQSAFAEMIYKSILYLKKASDLIDSGTHNPTTEETTKRILKAKTLLLIGISPDVPPIFSSKPFREILEEKVIAEVGIETWKWLNSNFKVTWHIISLHEFQAFLCLKGAKNFSKTIRKYFEDSKLLSKPLSQYDIADSYRSYILKKYGVIQNNGKLITVHPDLKAVYDSFVADTQNYLGFTNREIPNE